MSTPHADACWAALVVALTDLADAYYRVGRISAALHLLEQGDELLRGPTEQDVPQRERHHLALAKGRLQVHQIFLANHDYEPPLLTLEPVADSAAEDRRSAVPPSGGRSEEGDPRSTVDALDQIGLALYYRMMQRGIGGYDLALDAFQRALAQREALGDPGDSRGMAESLFHVGLAHERMAESFFHVGRTQESRDHGDAARDYYQRSLAVAQAHGHTLEESYALRHLAGIAQDHGDLDQALDYFVRSLALREAAGYTILVPFALLSLGGVREARGDLESALADYSRAAELASTLEAPTAEVHCLLALGNLQGDLGNALKARECYDRALALANAIDFRRGIEAATRALADRS